MRAPRPRPSGFDRLAAVVEINLAHRTERHAGFAAEMRRVGVGTFERFDAIPHERGIVGCGLSHHAVVCRMVDEGWPTLMVCEEDARFVGDRRRLDMLLDAFLDDPQANVLCLAYHARAVSPYNRLFLRASASWTVACYVLKQSIAPPLLELWERGLERTVAVDDPTHYVDRIWVELQQERVFLLPIRRGAFQAPSYSDIIRREVDYGL